MGLMEKDPLVHSLAHLRKSMTGKRSFPPNPMGLRNYGFTLELAGRWEGSRS